MDRALLLLLLLSGAPDVDERIELAQLRIEQRVIIRVPQAVPPPPPAAHAPDPPPVWREKDGPRCLKMKDIHGAAEGGKDGIDMLMADGQRYRAILERGCRSGDFYAGFYMEPTRDGTLCAKRDAIQARNGADCKVQEFRQLVPKK